MEREEKRSAAGSVELEKLGQGHQWMDRVEE